MSRTPDQVLEGLMALVPPGAAWCRDLDGNLARTLTPLANELSRFEGSAEAQLLEAHPGTAVVLLPAYERVLGPDPCLPDPATLTLAQRQAVAAQRWTDQGGCSIAYFEALGAAYRTTVAIGEFVTSDCGASVCGDEMIPEGGQFVLRFTVVEGPIGLLPAATIGCLIAARLPAHVSALFEYG